MSEEAVDGQPVVGLRTLRPDEPDKRVLLRLDTLYSTIHDEQRVRGLVTWESTPPAHVCYQTHKFSFLDALEMGFCMLRTDFFEDWVVLGPCAAAVMVTLPQFVVVHPPEKAGHYNLIGRLGARRIYHDPQMQPAADFYMGTHGYCIRGCIQNFPLAMQ